MSSGQEVFDAKKARHEIFQEGKRTTKIVIEFVVRMAEALIERKRPDHFVNVLNKSAEILNGESTLRNQMLSRVAIYATSQTDHGRMLKYYLVIEKLWDFTNALNPTGSDLLLKIGVGFLQTSNFKKAIEYSYKAKNAASGRFFPDFVLVGCYEILGNAYQGLGLYDKAMFYHNKCLKIGRKFNHKETLGSCYVNLGIVHHCLGQYEKSIQFFEESLKTALELRNSHLKSLSFSGLGNAYCCIGQNKKAIDYHKKAISMTNEHEQAKSYISMGNAYRNLGKCRESILSFEKGLALCERVGDKRGAAIGKGNLGSTYSLLREFTKATGYFKESIKTFEQIGDRSGLNTAYGYLGYMYYLMNEYDSAIQYLKKSRQIAVDIGDKWSDAHKLENLGLCYYCMGIGIKQKSKNFDHLICAEQHLKDSVRGYDRIFEEFVADQKKSYFTNMYARSFMALMSLYALLGRLEAAILAGDLGRAKALQSLIEQGNKSVGASVLSYTRLTWQSIDEMKEKRQLQNIMAALGIKDNDVTLLFYCFDYFGLLFIWVLTSNDCVSYKLWNANNDTKLTAEWLYEAVHDLLKYFQVNLQRNSTFQKRDFAPVDIFLQCEKHISPSEQSTVYDLFNTNYLGPKNGKVCESTSGNVSNSESRRCTQLFEKFETVSNLKSQTSDSRPEKAPKFITKGLAENLGVKSLEKLFQALILPVKDLISGTKLIIVPDKTLFFVPFCALMDENMSYLSESYSIQMASSIHTLFSSVSTPQHTDLGAALFVGNPTVGKVNLEGNETNVPPLPSAAEEAKYLASLFDAKALVEHEASKDVVLERISGSEIIHIAAHAHRKRGEILLAPNPGWERVSSIPKEKFYMLKEKDIGNVCISARFVVLCCCHTGMGEIAAEGVIGLARSFLGSGARSVLVALWPISDEGTKVFMKRFYEEIFKEISVCDALKTTMNVFQRHETTSYSSPRIWAPFTIFGEDVKFTKQDIEEIKTKSRGVIACHCECS